ncbi:MAG: type III secretion system chaperone [Deltaproteobacteria bacterium]|nr:type III secretion system chaperone [Deltaproteobacteria bacterium]
MDDMEKMFRALLDGLAAALGLPEISTAGDGRDALVAIDDFELCLRCVSPGDVLLFTVVAPLPGNNRQEVMAALLDANTFYYQTQGFTLAAREDTGVTLQGILSLRVLDRDNIGTFVQNFLNVADYWQKFCQDKEKKADSSVSQDSLRRPDDVRDMLYLKA